MSGPGRSFDPAELSGGDDTPAGRDELAAATAMARELERYGASTSVSPSPDFADRVMAAVADEAPPRLVVTGGRLSGFLAAIRDAWRITWSGDRPLAVRAQALALVLLVAVALGATGTLAAVGAARLLTPEQPPAPSVLPPSVAPTLVAPSASPVGPSEAPTVLPTPSTTPSPAATETAEPSETLEPSETPEGTDDHSGSGGEGGQSTATPRATKTPHPTDTAEPEDTPEPDDTGEPDDTAEPDDTPHPTDTPKPSGTPDDHEDR